MIRQSLAHAFYALCTAIITAYVALSIAAPGLAACVFRGVCG